MPQDLERFVAAQNVVLDDVRKELARGEKRSHWMWFVFPQVAGLGLSSTAQFYAIQDLAEAGRYLAHPVLGRRLAECTQLMLDWAPRRSASAILGTVDALKFCSSMTLFKVAAQDTGGDSEVFGRALEAFCQGPRDERTLQLLRTDGVGNQHSRPREI
ncbi:DUF1810 family protein [Novosphingobium sp. FGD1]|jgi:uncharacterized protein (DUF1810 family)|uniref:DUF1810 family protein n=1 Tax=Novosphingobium silvae TaxID=2692619 RepID=A0A7X4GH79_9SPHN|nr:DUF1810 domain-containing protein [Novosphingobium silvae]MYL98608.1 DUF1810 family protein [Novosphingobium silvae]